MNQAELFSIEQPLSVVKDSFTTEKGIIFPASGKRSDGETSLLASTKRSGAINPDEAPPGYYAVPKSAAKAETKGANICRACDWRPRCDGRAYRCMTGEATCSESGETLKRQDGCSVVFKVKKSEGGRYEPT